MSTLREVYDLFRIPKSHRPGLTRYFNRRVSGKPISWIVLRWLLNPAFLSKARITLTKNFLERIKNAA